MGLFSEKAELKDAISKIEEFKHEDAINICRRLEHNIGAKSDNDKRFIYMVLSLLYLERGDSKNAIKYSDKLISINKGLVSRVISIISNFSAKDYETAAGDIAETARRKERGIYSDELDSKYIHGDAILSLLATIALLNLNEYETASKTIENAIILDTKNKFLGEELLLKSVIFIYKNDMKTANESLKAAIKIGYKTNRQLLGKILKLMKNMKKQHKPSSTLLSDIENELINSVVEDILYNLISEKDTAELDYYKSRADQNSTGLTEIFMAESPVLGFSEVVDMEIQKEELSKYIIYPLKYPDSVSDYKVNAGGGVLLYGPPGCGKTYVVRATAAEAKVKFINVRIPDIVDALVGNTEKNIHNLFEYARNNAPSIIFFDELDALGISRQEASSYPWIRQAVNTMLNEMNNLYERGHKVLVVGASNEPWLIDSALRRSGRFGRTIYVPAPNEEVRISLFKKYLSGRPIEENINFTALAKLTRFCSHSDIQSICEDAARTVWSRSISGTVNGKQLISFADLKESVSKAKFIVPEWYQKAADYLGANITGYPELVDALEEYRGSM
jgi:SpoVK/Ycf46/Vps4 family AAA+-type ATPase